MLPLIGAEWQQSVSRTPLGLVPLRRFGAEPDARIRFTAAADLRGRPILEHFPTRDVSTPLSEPTTQVVGRLRRGPSLMRRGTVSTGWQGGRLARVSGTRVHPRRYPLPAFRRDRRPAGGVVRRDRAGCATGPVRRGITYLRAGRPELRQQRRQIGQVDVAVAIQIAAARSGASGSEIR